MKSIRRRNVRCPHCGSTISMMFDLSNGSDEIYDDCPACCHSIHINVILNEIDDEMSLMVDADDEQIF
ncbi:CPXCG motif-containing cysteine-rich protein [Vibrio profundum]|uniref:CPXCG motif-containing cysteine-rich protein n=1 Tax=Vibrio profundum TaxID=2910247 RepID=UPI003D11588E